MPSSDKLLFIRAYFTEFKEKIIRLEGFSRNSFKEEALVLCVVYIDQLASGRYYNGKENSKETFCRALRELSGNDFFSSIHPKCLLDESLKHGRKIHGFIESIVLAHPSQFLKQDEVSRYVGVSSLPDGTKSSLIANLWRASVATVCYDRIRCQAVHGPGRGIPLSFNKTTYNGQAGMTIDFDLLYSALKAIHKKVESLSLESCEWFGNPQYK